MKFFKKGLHQYLFCFLMVSMIFMMTSSPSRAEKVELTMFIWAGANQGIVPREVVSEYLKTHPDVDIKFYESNNAVTYPKMVAAQKTTPDQPLVHFGFFNIDATSKGDVDDMWDSLDPKRIPNMNLEDKPFWRKDNKGMTYGGTTIGLMYNKVKVKEPPTSWSDLWNPRFKGKVVLWDYNWWAQIMTARLNGGSEQNMDPAFKLWAKNAKQIHSLITSNDQLKNLVVSGDGWIAPWFSAIFRIWEGEGAPLAFSTPKEGAIFFPTYIQLVKGCTPAQKKVAEELINLFLSPEVNGRYNELTYGIPVVKGAKVSEKIRKDSLLSPDVLKNVIHLDWKTLSENNSEWKERWDKEVKPNL